LQFLHCNKKLKVHLVVLSTEVEAWQF